MKNKIKKIFCYHKFKNTEIDLKKINLKEKPFYISKEFECEKCGKKEYLRYLVK